jgi:molecular chaperone GrpE
MTTAPSENRLITLYLVSFLFSYTTPVRHIRQGNRSQAGQEKRGELRHPHRAQGISVAFLFTHFRFFFFPSHSTQVRSYYFYFFGLIDFIFFCNIIIMSATRTMIRNNSRLFILAMNPHQVVSRRCNTAPFKLFHPLVPCSTSNYSTTSAVTKRKYIRFHSSSSAGESARNRAQEEETATTAAAEDQSSTSNRTEVLEEAELPPPPSREEELEAQIKELKDQLKYSLAEQQNIRFQAQRDVDSARQFAVSSFAKSLLETSDNLERAMAAVPEAVRADRENHPDLCTLFEGIKMTEDILLKAFEKNGLKKFGIKGEIFDPNRHNALFVYPDPSATPGSVGQVMKAGFMLHGRVIRPADVGVIDKKK